MTDEPTPPPVALVVPAAEVKHPLHGVDKFTVSPTLEKLLLDESEGWDVEDLGDAPIHGATRLSDQLYITLDVMIRKHRKNQNKTPRVALSAALCRWMIATYEANGWEDRERGLRIIRQKSDPEQLALYCYRATPDFPSVTYWATPARRAMASWSFLHALRKDNAWGIQFRRRWEVTPVPGTTRALISKKSVILPASVRKP